jgi:hypothetical protein
LDTGETSTLGQRKENMDSLLQQFLAEDGTPYVQALLVDAVDEYAARPAARQKRFEFNRFDVTLDFDSKSVLIEDVLEPGIGGETRIGLDEFLRHLDGGQRAALM